MTMTEDIERVLALSKLATGGVVQDGVVGFIATRLVAYNGEDVRFFADTHDNNRNFIAAAVNAWREHGPTIAALAERLADAEEKVRVLEAEKAEKVRSAQAWSDIADRQM